LQHETIGKQTFKKVVEWPLVTLVKAPRPNDIVQGDGIEAMQIGSFPNKIYPKTTALTSP
jgi:hypothetical protein